MSTNFPNNLDTITKPTSANKLNEVPHSTLHQNEVDAIEAIQVYVGVVSSSDPQSLTYKIDHMVLSSSGASSSLSYLTVSDESLSLPSSKQITAGPNITINTNGNKLEITGSASGGGTGDNAASYLVLSTTSSLTNERVFTVGSHLSASDGGSGGALSVSVNEDTLKNALLATFAPASASYVVIGASGTLANERVLAGKNGVEIIDGGANGSVEISTPFANAQFLTLSTTGTLPNERVLTAGGHIQMSDDGAGSTLTVQVNSASLVAYVTESVDSRYLQTAAANVFVHSATPTGNQKSLIAGSGITFSESTPNRVTASLNIVAGPNITITNNNGAYEITGASGGSGGTGDNAASYVVLSTTASLSNERRLVTGSLLTKVDEGAGGDVVLDVNLPALTASLNDVYAPKLPGYSPVIFSQAAPIIGNLSNLAFQTNLMTQYMGYFVSGTVINNAWLTISTASTASTDLTEFGIASSSFGPIGASTTLTLLTSSVMITSGVSTGLRSTVTPFGFTCGENMHLWYIIRSNATSAQAMGYGSQAVQLYVGSYIQMRKTGLPGVFPNLSASHGSTIDTWVSNGGNFPVIYWSSY